MSTKYEQQLKMFAELAENSLRLLRIEQLLLELAKKAKIKIPSDPTESTGE